MDYDGCSDGRNIAGLLRACMAFGKMVPEAGGRRGVSAGKKAARRIHKCWYCGIVLLLGCYLIYALVHPEKF